MHYCVSSAMQWTERRETPVKWATSTFECPALTRSRARVAAAFLACFFLRPTGLTTAGIGRFYSFWLSLDVPEFPELGVPKFREPTKDA